MCLSCYVLQCVTLCAMQYLALHVYITMLCVKRVTLRCVTCNTLRYNETLQQPLQAREKQTSVRRYYPDSRSSGFLSALNVHACISENTEHPCRLTIVRQRVDARRNETNCLRTTVPLQRCTVYAAYVRNPGRNFTRV